jgi:peptidyl-prolyl cis-trans isomerase B (cyclophilin B)
MCVNIVAVRSTTKTGLILVISLILSFSQQQPVFAASKISNVTFSNQTPKAFDVFTLQFDLNRDSLTEPEYLIGVNFYSVRDSFSALAKLHESNYSNGKWRAIITVPGDIYTGEFKLLFTELDNTGKTKASKEKFEESNSTVIKILGKPIPEPPFIEVLNITTDKEIYSGGSTIRISFDTKILYGTPNEETYNPEVKLWGLRFNEFVRPTTYPYKPIKATGNYISGKWIVDYPIGAGQLSTQAQIYIDTPRGYDRDSLITKGKIIQLQSPLNEIVISDVYLDKDVYEEKTKVRVTFSTTSIGSSLNSANKPFIILSDLENSDLSDKIETTLISGTLDKGQWLAEFDAPAFYRFDPPIASYSLKFYNSAGTIRETGPNLIIKENTPKKESEIAATSNSGSAVVECRETKAVPHAPKNVEAPKTTLNTYPYVITLVTNCGEIDILLASKQAPVTTTSLLTLIRGNFYDDSLCHRLTTSGIYVIQCGDPTATGSGQAKWSFIDENLPPSSVNNYPAGTVAMANSGPNTNSSQFFIAYKDSPIGPNYSIWGQIISGMEVLRYIASKGAINGFADGMPAVTLSINSIIERDADYLKQSTKDVVEKAGTAMTTDLTSSTRILETGKEAEAKAVELKAKQEAEAKVTEEKMATELKVKQEAEAKIAAEKAAGEKIISDAKAEAARILAETKAKVATAAKKITITCVKGKLTKKVTAVKPVCPAGYKKK